MSIQRFSNVEFEHWDALRDAVGQLVANGTYEGLVNYHSHRYRMHSRDSQRNYSRVGEQRFLSWHRAYLINFERKLREIDESLSIPYWDWNEDEGQLKGFLDRFGMPPTPRVGQRRPQDERDWGKSISDICRTKYLLSPDNFDDFTTRLEGGPHNTGHGWIGGDMARMTSPKDTAFWFHHAQVDRIWSLWQRENLNKMSDLSGTNAELDPWDDQFSIDSVNNIADLGDDSYEYVEPRGTTA